MNKSKIINVQPEQKLNIGMQPIVIPSSPAIANTHVSRSLVRPILFSSEMIKAILDGRKRITRRVYKSKHLKGFEKEIASIHKDGSGTGWIAWSPKPVSAEETKKLYPNDEGFKCPYGKIGDILWVRETWFNDADFGESPVYVYKSGNENFPRGSSPWKPSIFMPKAACRIFLKITGIDMERLQSISSSDAQNEGVYGVKWHESDYSGIPDYKTAFKNLWIKINGQKSWDENPFVWVLSFQKCERPKGFC